LGGEAVHEDSSKREGLGYRDRIERFDRLLSKLQVAEQATLSETQRLIDRVRRDTCQKELTAFLAKESGKPKRLINKAISGTKHGGEDFENLLGKLGEKEKKEKK
jgi:hypothetical protein